MHDLLSSLQEVLGDRYQLEGELGRGGMATVYRATDTRYARTVAIKVLPPEMATVLGRERFTREIAISANLQHPNIVPLFDSGGEGDVLFYVMPLVAGETLRDRLDRETQLPVDDALAITRDIAEALGYAHSQGVVHRDIKPENILLSGGRAMVTDFGIARALATVEADRLTEHGLTPGTPLYMSPEQASGSYLVDGRADLYSLGCVLYEMLAGSPPFTGRTYQVILARHIQEKPPSLQVARSTVSIGVAQVVERLLQKVPADRYQTAAHLVAAMNLAAHEQPVEPGVRWKPWAAVVAVFAVLLALAKFGTDNIPRWFGTDAEPDTSRYALLPFEREAGLGAGQGEEQLLHDALTRWTGIAVVDPFQVRDAVARRGGGAIDSREARRVALALGAGRYVRGEVSRIGDSLRVRAAVFDARTGSQVIEGAQKVPSTLAGADNAFANLADVLLFRGAGPGGRTEGSLGTLSAPARQAFARGHAAIGRWDLPAADSAFVQSAAFDPEYAQAHLWLAVVRSWSGAQVSRWQSAAEQAAAGRDRLSERDQQMSDALLASAREDVPLACNTWRRLAVRDTFDFAPWFGLGECLSHDDAVIRSGSSRSGWQFRASYHEALSAYERAFLLLPSMHRALRSRSYLLVSRLFKTSWRSQRGGRALRPDTTTFRASPEWLGDTLAFVPYRSAEVLGSSWRPAPTTISAFNNERRRFRAVASAWVASFPASPDALEALALALEMLGDRSALDTLRRARTLVGTREDSARMAVDEVWMRVRLAVPADTFGLRYARVLADSTLRRFPPGAAPEPLLLASLAALTGRPSLAASYSRQSAVSTEYSIPGPLSEGAFPLLLYSALGGPLDSVRSWESGIERAIRQQLPLSQQVRFRSSWLARAAALTYPDYQFASLPQLVGLGDYLVDAQAALGRGDTAFVRGVIGDLEVARHGLPPGSVTFDGLYPEARLIAATLPPQRAIDWLEPTLNALEAVEPFAFTNPVQAATLVRAMAFRAELASTVHDQAGAARWSRCVLILWSGAEPFAAAQLQRLRGLSGGTQ